MPVFIPKKTETKAKAKAKKAEVTMKSIPGQAMTEEEVREMLKAVGGCRRSREGSGSGSGRVSEEELKKVVERLGSRWAAFRTFLCLQHADTNKDGQISGAEIDKLVAYILKWQAGKLKK